MVFSESQNSQRHEMLWARPSQWCAGNRVVFFFLLFKKKKDQAEEIWIIIKDSSHWGKMVDWPLIKFMTEKSVTLNNLKRFCAEGWSCIPPSLLSNVIKHTLPYITDNVAHCKSEWTLLSSQSYTSIERQTCKWTGYTV